MCAQAEMQLQLSAAPERLKLGKGPHCCRCQAAISCRQLNLKMSPYTDLCTSRGGNSASSVSVPCYSNAIVGVVLEPHARKAEARTRLVMLPMSDSSIPCHHCHTRARHRPAAGSKAKRDVAAAVRQASWTCGQWFLPGGVAPPSNTWQAVRATLKSTRAVHPLGRGGCPCARDGIT